MKRLQKWSTTMRLNLEYLLRAGYNMQDICAQMVISRSALFTELERGLSEENFAAKRYIPYSAELATYSLAVKDLDDEGIELLRKHINAKR